MKKLVPIEPTGSMLDAGKRVMPALRFDLMKAIWKVMVEAAPSDHQLNPHALSRSTDPGTSRMAAKKADLKINESRRIVLGYAIQRDPTGGFIDDDLRRTYANGETLRKRRSDLTDAGYIAPVEGLTRLNRSGNSEQVWRVTDKGRNAL